MDEFDDLDGFDDGNNESYLAERDRFIAEFESKLLAGRTDFGYDMFDWVMLADYAMDVENIFVISEAVNRGLQAFPNSNELRDRRLLFYTHILNDEDLRKAFTAAYNQDSPSKLVRMYMAYYNWRDLPKRSATAKRGYKELAEAVFDGEKLYDIDIIEVIRILSWMKAVKYLIKDIKKWEDSVHNIEMLWYEVLPEAFAIGELEFAESIADKLVSEYPYNRQYWMMKAQSIISRLVKEHSADKNKVLPRFDEVLNILDTVLAIEPQDEAAMALRHKTLDLRDSLAVGQLSLEDIEEDLTYNPDRKPWDVMTLNELRALLESADAAAETILRDWVSYQVDLITGGVTDENYPQVNLIELVKAVYLLRYNDGVDFLLDIVQDYTDKDIEGLLPIRVLRLLANGDPLKATELFTHIDNLMPWGDLNPTKLLLSVVIEHHMRLYEEGAKLASQLTAQAVTHLADLSKPGRNIFAYVDPCVIDYFITYCAFINGNGPDN